MVGSEPDGVALSQRLLERADELAAADELLADAREGRGGLLALEAAAGIGKSALLAAVADRAAAAGLGVLRARADELEHDLAFGVVRQLLSDAVAADPGLIAAGAPALAGPVLGYDGPAPSVGGDPLGAALHGLHWLVTELADRRPLLLVVDDAHWADDASLRFLAYLARRLEDLPVLLALAGRPGEPRAERRPLAAVMHESGGRRLAPSPLSPEASSVLVRDALPGAGDELCAACRSTTGGNPFLLRELVASLAAEHAGELPEPEAVSAIAPAAVARSVLVRVLRLSEAAGALARSVALFPEGAAFRHVATLAGLDEDAAAAAADELVAASVLAPERPLRFLHPLMRTAVHEDLPAAARARAHARAADLLLAEGAPVEAIAAHVLAAEPAARPEYVRVLADAASHASAVGAVDAAVRYLRRALEEPPAAEARAGVLHQLGLAEMLTGIPGAIDRLSGAVEAATDPALRRAAAFDLGRGLGLAGRPLEGAGAIDRAIATFGDEADPEEVLTYQAEALWLLSQQPQGVAEYTRRLDAIPDPAGTTRAQKLILCHKAALACERREDVERVLSLARRALDGLRLRDGGLDSAPAMSFASSALIHCGAIAEAARINSQAIEDVRAAGALVAVPMGHAGQTWIEWLAGDLAEVEHQARLTLATVADQEPDHPARSAGLSALMIALIETGRVDEAVALAPEGEFTVQDGFRIGLVAARGRVRLAAGDLDGAAADFERVGAWWRERGVTEDIGDSWRGYLAVVRARQGREDEARELADSLVAEARRFGAHWPLGEALHAAALTRSGDERIALLHEAVEVLAPSEARLHHAKALVDLGAALRIAARRVEARERLREGLELARRCGASALAARAEEELGASGARLRREALSGAGSLTPSETRIARLAAAGRTNREIAEELWLTQKTVEMHLRNAYRKLDISSRVELPAALAA